MNSAVTCSVIFFILGDNMKALIKRNKKNIIIGVLIVVLLPVLLFVSGKIYHKIRDNYLYGDIYDLAEKNGLSICNIDPDSVKGVEIYFSNNARRPQVMQSLYNFSKELEDSLSRMLSVIIHKADNITLGILKSCHFGIYLSVVS